MPIVLPKEITDLPPPGKYNIVLYKSSYVTVRATLYARDPKSYYSPFIRIEAKFKSFDTDPAKLCTRARVLFSSNIGYSNGVLADTYLLTTLDKYNSILEWVVDDFKDNIETSHYKIQRYERKINEEKSKQNFYKNVIGKL